MGWLLHRGEPDSKRTPLLTGSIVPVSRWWKRIVVGGVLLALLVLLAGWLALRTESVRRSLLTRLSVAVEEATGLTVDANSLDLWPSAGTVELRGVRLTNSSGETVATADRLSATVRLTALATGSLVFESLALDAPHVDLSRWPESDEPTAEPGPPPSLDVHAIVVAGGSLAAVGLEGAAGGTVAPVDFDLEGSLVDGVLSIEIEGGALRVDHPDLGSRRVEVSGELSGPIAGPLSVTGLDLRGGGVDLSLSGQVGLAESQPFALSAVGSVELGALLGAAEGARVGLQGAADLRGGEATVSIDAPEVPAELLQPWVGDDLFAQLDAEATVLTLAGDVRLGPARFESAEGDLELRWRRGEEELLVAELTPDLSVERRRARVPIAVRVAPALPGRREFRGVLAVEDWQRPTEAEIEEGRVVVEQAAGDFDALRGLWPTALATLPVSATGELRVAGDVVGPVTDPRLEIEGRWQAAQSADLEFVASGAPVGRSGAVRAAADRFPLEVLGLGWSGALSGDLELAAEGGELSSARFDLSASRLASGEAAPADLAARGELAGEVLTLERLEIENGGRRLETIGSVRLTDGGLRLSATPLSIDGVELHVTADVPGSRLSGIPGLDSITWAGEFARQSRARVDWVLEGADLAPLLGVAGSELFVVAAGEAWVDTKRPALSSGNLRLEALRWTEEARSYELERPVTVELTDGRLTVPTIALATGGSRVEAGGWLELTPSWGVEDAIEDLIARGELQATGRVAEALFGVPASTRSIDFEASVEAEPERLSTHSIVNAPESRFEATGWLDRQGGAFDWRVDGDAAGAWLAALGGVEGAVEGRVRLDARYTRSDDGVAGHVRLESSDFEWPLELMRLADPEFELQLGDREVRLQSAGARLNDQPVVATGEARLLQEGGNGALEVDRLELSLGGVESTWQASIPIQLDGEEPTGELAVAWQLPETDLEPLLLLLGASESEDSFRAGGSGWFRLPLTAPTLGEGEAEVAGLAWKSKGREAAGDGPIRLVLSAGELTLPPARLVSEGRGFELEGTAGLAPDWQFGEEASELVEEVELVGGGALLASLANPFLAGGVAEGEVELSLDVRGRPGALRGRLEARGPDASVVYARPYTTRISAPDLVVTLDPTEGTRADGGFRLNEGSVDLSTTLDGNGSPRVRAELEGVRYRLDYGLLALMGGDVSLARDPEGEWSVTGAVEVENGVLSRDVDLDLDLLLGLLAPVDLTSTEESSLEAFALDLELRTTEGVRIKNNVADLWVRWDPVKIGGTLAAPVLDGRFDVEPGGRVYAFGQTVRVDTASLDYPGAPDLPASLDLSVTSSIEDPSIAGLGADDPFASERDVTDEEVDRVEAVATGLGSFYGERLAARLTSGVTGARISLQPLLIFGEADPGTRLTVSQDFSPIVTLAASVDLRNAEARTYLLDVHDLDTLPGLNVQLFTTDDESEGAALGQRLRLGGDRRDEQDGPKIRKIRYRDLGGQRKWRIRRALGLGRGDRLFDGARFGAEIEVIESLRARGYVDPRVAVTPREVERGVELDVDVEPGARASFDFQGTRIPKSLRRRVAELYRSDDWESASLLEMKAEARRALRSIGYVDPRAEIETAVAEGLDRRVIVHLEGGERLELGEVRFVPLPDDENRLLASRFARPVRRVELAAELPEADRRVEQALRYLGYQEPRIASRRVVEEGAVLEVVLEPGPRPTLRTVEIAGAPEGAEVELASGLLTGEPVRHDRIAAAGVRLRDALQAQGYSDVTVRPALTGDDPVDLRFDVEPGVQYFVGQVAFSGLQTTRPGFAERVAALEIEADFDRDEVLEARRRLWRTELFDTVTPEIVRAPGGVVRVDFDMRERPRFELAYGVRWDSEDDTAVLLEAIDRNVLGRGWTAGVRTLWSSDDQIVRGFAGLPRVFGPRSSLEFFASARELVEDGLITDTLEGTVQLSWRLAERLTARLYGRVTESRVEEEEPDPFFPFEVRITRPIVGTQVLFDGRSGDLLTRRGLFGSADLSWSDESFGSDFEYGRFFGQLDYHRPLGGRGSSWSWSQSMRVGLADAFDQELVRLDRFFAGGEFSVRGYLTESLGPQERLGTTERPLGGEALLVLSEELRWRFADRFSAVLFADVGNVWADRGDFGSDLFTSAGVGLRALTPLGLLRVDFARALDRRAFDPSYKLYFGFGNTF